MNSQIKVAIYGGAFNPPHAGHADAMLQASAFAHRILVVPSCRHAFGKVLNDLEERATLLNRIVSEIKGPALIEVDTIERELATQQAGAIYSYDLLTAIANREGLETKQVALVIGEDNVQTLSRFYRSADLIQDFSLVVIQERLGVHSSKIKELLAQGLDFPAEWVAPGLCRADYDIYNPSAMPICA
ncbi:nicotinate-nucleotide adenylyltransferase [Pseudomonas nitritireducens]|uniref:nicotinate-nucleotide adenylyltransferase n=1 Tax=Pseudomonas nitroreducens TaxID=46680 RepID=A0A7W7KRC0_PSENT|nr:cytidyltransferase [Pseudomonas nitritireducens]MBB4866838.1 nicotinate-nucleotide adenylyltransferase [Pseudomonas nitritireducens]